MTNFFPVVIFLFLAAIIGYGLAILLVIGMRVYWFFAKIKRDLHNV